jgi:uncharacterized protein
LSWVVFLGVLVIILLIDFYVFQGTKTLLKKWPFVWRRGIYFIYWSVTAYIILSFLFYKVLGPQGVSPHLQRWSTTLFFIIYVSKLPALMLLIVDDLIRFFQWGIPKLSQPKNQRPGKKISRSQFLVRASVVAAAIPAATLGFGILSSAYDYRVRRKRVPIVGLPDAFHGIRIGQLSDIHSGSFFNKTAVEGGVELFMHEKPDLFVFTGDLVNNETTEVRDYKNVFAKVKAPLGSFSTLGNHDYGDYRSWSSGAAKQKNLNDLVQVHREMGWDLLRNENRIITIGGEKLSLIGVENWGKGRFAKYGDLAKAYEGTEDIGTKILLSHDPSHWDAQVRPGYEDIDLMLAGHTHGFQFGVEIGNFRWSPSQYMYKQWADLYSEGNQHLYVNRGFGFLGYPGRIGIMPEVTILELVKA